MGLDHTLKLGWPSRHSNRRGHRRARLKFTKMEFTWLFCLDRTSMKRQNNGGIQQQNLPKTSDVSTQLPFRNNSGPQNDRFLVLFRSFVVLSFRRFGVPIAPKS